MIDCAKMAHAFQVQVSYRNKTRQIYLKGTVTYSEFCHVITEQIPSIGFTEFQITYENEDGIIVTMSDNEVDICDLFRCAVPVKNADYRRIRVSLVEGGSPASIPMRKHSHSEKDQSLCPQPKKLNFDTSRETEIPHVRKKSDDYEYTSPLQLDIENRERELSDLKAELKSVEGEISAMNEKYSADFVQDGTKKRCGRCHLREGHNKSQCPHEACKSAQMCGDINHPAHADEKVVLGTHAKRRCELEKEIKKGETELAQKRELSDALLTSFERNIESALINSGKERYLVETDNGLQPKRYLLNHDIAILKSHYNGKVPSNVEHEKAKFQRIISSYKKERGLMTKPINRVRQMLESNPKYRVTFPSKSPPTTTAPSVEDKSADHAETLDRESDCSGHPSPDTSAPVAAGIPPSSYPLEGHNSAPLYGTGTYSPGYSYPTPYTYPYSSVFNPYTYQDVGSVPFIPVQPTLAASTAVGQQVYAHSPLSTNTSFNIRNNTEIGMPYSFLPPPPPLPQDTVFPVGQPSIPPERKD